MQPQPNPAGDDLRVHTVLVRDPDALRAMLYTQIQAWANLVAKDAQECGRAAAAGGRPYTSSIDRVREGLSRLDTCAELMGQIGWAKPRKGRR